MKPEPGVRGPFLRFPNLCVNTQRNLVNVLVMLRKQFDVVVARNDDLVVDIHPVGEPLVELRGFPHRETGSPLVLVERFDLVWLHHVDHHVGVFVQRHVVGHVVHEAFEHRTVAVAWMRVAEPGLVVQSAVFSSFADPSIFIGCPPVRRIRL